MYVSISLQPDIGTFLKTEPGAADGDQMDSLYLGEVTTLGQFVAMDLKQDLGLQQQGKDAGAMEEGVEGAMNLPLTATRGGPCCQGPAGRDGGLGPHTQVSGEPQGMGPQHYDWAWLPGGDHPTSSGPPAPAPPAPAPPAAASRSSGMTMQQWAAVEASSGGGPAKPTRAGSKPPQRKSLTKGNRTRAITSASAGVAAQGGGRHSRCRQTTLLEGS